MILDAKEKEENVTKENVVELDGCGFSNIFKKREKSESDEEQPLVERQAAGVKVAIPQIPR